MAKLRAALAADPAASEEFEFRLRLAGYEDRPEYGLRTVTFGPSSCFKVVAGFPRIERPAVSAGVVSCQYRLRTADVEPFRVGTWCDGGTHAE